MMLNWKGLQKVLHLRCVPCPVFNIGTSRFIKNKIMHFGKSYFMATMGISIHEEKISISHFMNNKKAQSEVRKILITTFINVNHIYLQLRTTREHQSLMY